VNFASAGSASELYGPPRLPGESRREDKTRQFEEMTMPVKMAKEEKVEEPGQNQTVFLS
jgi:hypothetical protein